MGYIVSARGIEPNPDKVSSITNMKRPTCVKDIQKLTGCMAALSCFMGGRLRFLGHARYSYACMGSTLDVMDYGLAKAIGTSSRRTGRMLLELRITAPV